jgi:hypothetical protein
MREAASRGGLPWVKLWSGAKVHERMRRCFKHSIQEQPRIPRRSVRKTKVMEGGSNQ